MRPDGGQWRESALRRLLEDDLLPRRRGRFGSPLPGGVGPLRRTATTTQGLHLGERGGEARRTSYRGSSQAIDVSSRNDPRLPRAGEWVEWGLHPPRRGGLPHQLARGDAAGPHSGCPVAHGARYRQPSDLRADYASRQYVGRVGGARVVTGTLHLTLHAPQLRRVRWRKNESQYLDGRSGCRHVPVRISRHTFAPSQIGYGGVFCPRLPPVAEVLQLPRDA